ncbi:MAG: hypothetical protein ONB42_07280, partial [candidate division KSB1 bacterium]|nr:hypothetical protein [candidate division KSB1 bacterium]
PARLVGRLQIDGLDITVGTIMRIHDLKGICHFDQDFDYLYFPLTSSPPKNYGMLLEPDSVFQPVLVLKPSKEKSHESFASAGEALLMYDIFRGSMNQDMSRRSWLRIGQIDVLGHKISEVIADLVIGNCRFDVPKFSMNLFGGNLVGNLLVGLGNGNPQGISYATTMQLSSIDVSNFRRLGAELQKESRLSADFFLSGSGASAEHLAEVVNTLSGRLNITKIENQVASNLLQALDPNGTDQGIQRMRLLLKTGWNVKQMTFEMKNGFIYASLLPVKPWFAPFNLPPTLDFARLPMKYFLESSKTE